MSLFSASNAGNLHINFRLPPKLSGGQGAESKKEIEATFSLNVHSILI